MKTKTFVTGSGGSIGVHMLGHIFHNTDWDVLATDSFRHKGYPDRIATMLEDHPEWRPRLTVMVHDLNAPFTTRELNSIGQVDSIINLASISDVQASIDDPVPTVRNNTELMLNMLEAARVLKPRVFLHFSTDEVYGPTTGDSKGHPEWATILPSNPYSASKAAQEALAIAWWRSFGVPLVLTNTMNNLGETQSPSKFPAMIQKKIENGETIDVHVSPTGEMGTRYYIHSRNVADAVLFIMRKDPTMHVPGQIDRPDRYNIVGDKQISNLDLVNTISKLMGKEAKIQTGDFHSKNPGHDLHYGLDGTKLAAEGWKPPVSFEDSLKNTIEWQKANPEWL